MADPEAPNMFRLFDPRLLTTDLGPSGGTISIAGANFEVGYGAFDRLDGTQKYGNQKVKLVFEDRSAIGDLDGGADRVSLEVGSARLRVTEDSAGNITVDAGRGASAYSDPVEIGPVAIQGKVSVFAGFYADEEGIGLAAGGGFGVQASTTGWAYVDGGFFGVRTRLIDWPDPIEAKEFDPIGEAIAALQEELPDVPPDVVEKVYLDALEDLADDRSGPWTIADWVYADDFLDPDYQPGQEFLATLEAMQEYFGYYGTDLPYPEDEGTPSNTGTDGGGNDPDHSRPDRSGDTPAVVVDTGLTYDPNKVPHDGGVKYPTPDPGLPADPDYYGVQPIILDLDGDGVEVAFGEDIYFDLDDDGFLEQTSWASADDGFLVIDRNADGTRGAGDGVIDQSNELVLSSLGLEGDTDLQALARYDDNSDGKLDANDAIWTELKVWQDLNQDGKTEGDGTELKTLAAWGISSINLAYDDGTDFTDESNDVEVFGNILHGLASFTMNGTVVTGGVGDMTLAYNTRGWREIELTDAGGAVIGYSIEFEGWKRFDYAVATGDTAADFDLTALALDGATGDDRHNVLDATGSLKAVTISGGVGNDTLLGGWDDDMIAGGVGADVIRGNGGNDVLFFDAADTVVEGGDGVDVAYATEEDIVDENGVVTTAAAGVVLHMDNAGIEAVYGGDGDDTLDVANTGYGTALSMNGGKGNDTLTSGAADDTLSGDAGDDTLSGNAGDDTLIGGAGEDTITGGSGADFILGGTDDDTLNAGDGDDFVLGGTGDDTIDGGDGDDYLDGGAGSDIIVDGFGDDFIIGGAGYDVITTGEGDDYVDAGAGNDTLSDSWGDDTFRGGSGDDVLNMSAIGGKNIYMGGQGRDTVKLVGNAADYTWTYQESGNEGKGQYTITTSSNGAHSSLTNYLLIVQDVEHLEFDDQTVDLANVDVAEDNSEDYKEITTLDGTGSSGPGNDTFNGTSGNDVKNLWAGDDVLNGKNGNDILTGHTGSDEIFGGNGTDELYGGYGSDTLVGGDGADTIEGSNGNDTIIGDGKELSTATELDETNVANGGGNDILSGGAGEDTILGGKGNDTIHGDDGADFVNAGIGDDTVYGDSGADQLYGGDGADTIYGGLGDDYIVADSGYSLDVTVHLLRYLSKGAEAKSVTESRVAELKVGGYTTENLVNSYLAEHYGSTADGAVFGTTVIKVVANDEITVTDAQFFGDVLPRVYGRAATADEVSYWQVKLDNGASYAAIILEAIEQAVVDPAKVQSVMVLFGEYTTAEAAALSFDDVVEGNEGDDEIYAGKGDDIVDGGAGHDKLHGGSGHDTLIGGQGSDSLLGGMGVDTLTGGAGADVLEGGHGADIIHGDNATNNGETSPFDTLSYEGSDAGVNINLLNSTASGGDAEGDTFDGIEWVAGSAYDDDLTGDASDNRLFGNGGSDALDGGAGNDQLYGGGGNDTLLGAAGDDRLYGDDGADVISGGAGDDLVVGGAGDDILSGGDGEDLLVGDGGADVFMLQDDGQDTVEDFTVGSDTIGIPAGLSLSDLTLTPAGINDADTVVTFANTALHGNASLYLSGVEVAELSATSVTSIEVGTSGADVLDLSLADHQVNIDGGAGADALTGSILNDTLAGGTGDDTLEGGDGDDTYVIDLNETLAYSTSEIDLTEAQRGVFTVSQTSTYTAGSSPAWFHAESVIDGDESTFNHTLEGATVEIDLKSDFALTRIVLNNRDHTNSIVTDRIIGATVQTLDENRQVLDSIEVTTLADLDFALSNSTAARYVQVLSDDDGYQDYIHLDEIQVFGIPAPEHDTIIDSAGSNTLRVDGSINPDDIIAVTNGDDLVLTFGNDDKSASVTITDQWLDLEAPAVEFLELSTGEIIDMRTFHELGGDDDLTGTSGADTLNGYIGNDEIDGGAGDDTLNGGEGNDRLLGGDGYDIINGGDGDDYIADGSGTGIFDGGDGIDTIDISHSSAGATVNLETETTVWTGGATETITNFENVVGSQGADTILGTDDSNVLDGQDGNDTITGGLGRDTLMGGAGDDTYIYNLGDGSDVIIEGAFGAHLFENYDDDGGSGSSDGGSYDPDSPLASEQEAGSDKIVFGAGISQSDLTFSDIGDDLFIHLPDGATIIIKGFVNQKVETLEFADGSTMDLTNRGDVTWTGKHKTWIASGVDDYFGGEGNDTLNAIGGHDTVQGGGGNDIMDGGSRDDHLYGGSGNDTINGGTDEDTLYGDSGDDIISGDAGVDYMDGGVGDDTVDFSYWTTEEADQEPGTVLAGVEIDLEAEFATWSPTLVETIANFENVVGSSGNDTITGTNEANVIEGGAGDDLIEAGAGDDTISGGTGANTYVFSRGDGMDTITDFNTGTDTLRIEGAAIANILIENVTYNGSGVLVTYGWDADGNPVDQVFLDGVPTSAFGYADIETVENAADGSNSVDIYVGTDAHENITMNGGDDDITAGGGNDDIDAGAGADTVHAGTGNDRVTGGTGADLIYLDAGDDIFVDDAETGTSGDDVVHGGEGNDLFLGEGGDDTFYGDEGNDTLNGGAGNDTLVGDAGITNGKLIATYYRLSNTVNSVQDIPVLTEPDGVRIVDDLDVNALAVELGGRADYYGVRYVGVIDVNTVGDYTFKTGSDDGSSLYIDGVEVVLNDGWHGLEYQSGIVQLDPGMHTIEMRFFESAYGQVFEATVKGPDTGAVELDIFASGMLGDAAASSDAPSGLGLEDVLNGGAGDDILTGGSGADILELDFGSGSDVMTDFEDGLDIIDLSATGLTFADLTIADNGSGDVVISFDDGDGATALDELTLAGITAAELTSADFQFG